VVGAKGLISGAIISSGGALTVSSGGVASATVIAQGGKEIVALGGSDNGAAVSGIEIIYGTDTSARIAAGGALTVSSGGTAIATVIAKGGKETVGAGGIDRGATVAGALTVAGSESGARIAAGGTVTVAAKGVISGAIISSGGALTVSSGGLASATTVDAGGRETILSGGTAGGLILSGGTAVISGIVGAGQTAKFAGPGGDLALDNLPAFKGQIAGFGAGDKIDLGGFAFAKSETVAFKEAASKTSGTLTVVDGSKTATLTLTGVYVTSNFALATDAAGGTFVSYKSGGPAVQTAEVHQMASAIAGFAPLTAAAPDHPLAVETPLPTPLGRPHERD
jgi:autotransporter passenger strand-loop-strand repeat protein